MRKNKEKQVALRGDQLLCSGDIVHVMDEGSPTRCRVLACLATESGSCLASLEILEGPKKGIRLDTSLVAGLKKQE